jgi:hypothetical protein
MDAHMRLKISTRIQKKLREKHGVTNKELFECFENRRGADLFDTRAEHLTDPLISLVSGVHKSLSVAEDRIHSSR